VAPWRWPLRVAVDATLVTAHSEKECAAPTFKRGFGFHPLWASLDHGPEDAGDPLALGRRRSISNCTVNRRTSRSSAPI
jgi:hypothetical protein